MTDGPAGRTTITARAFSSLVAAVAGDALGVPAQQVLSDIRDQDGMLALAVRAPIRIPALTAIDSEADVDVDVDERAGGTIIERTATAQRAIHTRMESLTGSTIARLDVRLTSAHIQSAQRTDRVDRRVR